MSSRQLQRGTILDSRGDVLVAPRTRGDLRQFAAAMGIYPGVGGYKGAKNDRTKGGWDPPMRSPDGDLIPDRRRLVDRSWDLERNDPIASGVLRTDVANIVGSGIRVESRVDAKMLGIDESQARELNQRIDRHWKRWIRECDYAGNAAHSLNWYEMQGLGVMNVLAAGECWLFPRYSRRGDYTLRLHMIEESRIKDPCWTEKPDENVIDGIRIDKDSGEELGIYVLREHPGKDGGWAIRPEEHRYVAALNRNGRANYWHIYKSKRCGSSRGVPVLSPVIDYFRRLDDYLGTEFIQAQVANLFTMWITSPDPWAMMAEGEDATQGSDLNPLRQDSITEVEPGALNFLKPGEDIKTAQNPHPSNNFEKFVDNALIFIGAGLGLPRELITRDFRQSNFSNTKAALIEARALFDGDQRFFKAKFCEPVRALFIEMLFLMGELPANYREYPEAYTAAAYLPSGWRDLDRYKDIQARDLAWRNGHTTLQKEYGEQGEDWEAMIDQWEIERKRIWEINTKYPMPGEQIQPDEPEPAPGEDGGSKNAAA